MGQYLSSQKNIPSSGHHSPAPRGSSGRKRERIVEFDLSEYLSVRKRRKLTSTSEHIYRRLFQEGADSDVMIHALGKSWSLHKVYLEQSPYFSSLFSGDWKESREDPELSLNIIDPIINTQSLNTAFSSLYRDELDLQLDSLIPLLATSSLLQFQGLQEQIEALMVETMNAGTVLDYREAAEIYGCLSVSKAATSWLKMNLLHALPQNLSTLASLPSQLLWELISSHDLFVNQTEFSVYILLRLWLYLQLQSDDEDHAWEGDPSEAVSCSHIYFKERFKKAQESFLESPGGEPYRDLFRALRLPYLINHHLDMEMLLTDGLVPMSWLYPVLASQWAKMLIVDQGLDLGPSSMEEKEFEEASLRCGRSLSEPSSSALWRWTGFNMGLDLIVHYEDGIISLRRNFKSEELLLSTNPHRSIFVRVTASSLNEQKQVVHRVSSGIRKLVLECSEESHELLRLDNLEEAWLKFPLCLAFNFRVSDKSCNVSV